MAIDTRSSKFYRKNQYFLLIFACLLGFIIPFYPVYLLITDNGQLGMGAFLVLYQMFATIPVGFVVGILTYRIFTQNKVRIFSPIIQFFVFALVSLTPVTIFGIFSYQSTIRYERQVSDFQIETTIKNEKILQQKSVSGQARTFYEFDLLLNNKSTQSFNSVSLYTALLNNSQQHLTFSLPETIILPVGLKTIRTKIDLSEASNFNARFTKVMTIKVTLTNKSNLIRKDFEYPSQLSNWTELNEKLSKQRADNTPVEGYRRFVNYKNRIQMDLPNDWVVAYGAETGSPPDTSEDATNHYFSKYNVGSINIQWDNSLPNNLCIQGVTESNIEMLMAKEISFLQTYKKLKTEGIQVRACVDNQDKVDEIKHILNTLKIINS